MAQHDPRALRRGPVLGHQALAAVDGPERKAAPEAVAALDDERLALVHEPEAQAAIAQPADRRAGVLHEDPRHLGVPAAERHPAQVAEEVLRGVGRQVGGGGQGVVDALDEVAQVVEPAVRKADGAGREGRVAARPLGVGLLEHEHAAAALARGVRGRQPRVAGSRHDDVPGPPVHAVVISRRASGYPCVRGDPRGRRKGGTGMALGSRAVIGGVLAVAAVVAIVAARRRLRRRRRVAAVPDAAALDHGARRARRRLGHDRARVPGRVARRRSSTTASRSSTSRARAGRSGSPSWSPSLAATRTS